jgi:hypothetical protein
MRTYWDRINQDFLDTARITWTSEIVSAFKPPPSSPPPDGFLKEYFEGDVETVLDFYNQHQGKSEDQLAVEARTILLSGLSNTRVGTYSRFHNNATYHLGYDHPVTIRLAYMYENLLFLSVITSFLNSIFSHHYTGLRRAWTRVNLASASTSTGSERTNEPGITHSHSA